MDHASITAPITKTIATATITSAITAAVLTIAHQTIIVDYYKLEIVSRGVIALPELLDLIYHHHLLINLNNLVKEALKKTKKNTQKFKILDLSM